MNPSPFFKGAIITLITLVLIASCVLQNAVYAAEPNQNEITPREFTFACRGLRELGFDQVNCAKAAKPIVVVTSLLDEAKGDWQFLYGLTILGEDYVFVNSMLEPEFQRAVVVHETVHFILFQFYGPLVGTCVSEAAARMVGAAWQKVPYDDSWMQDYGCEYRKGAAPQ